MDLFLHRRPLSSMHVSFKVLAGNKLARGRDSTGWNNRKRDMLHFVEGKQLKFLSGSRMKKINHELHSGHCLSLPSPLTSGAPCKARSIGCGTMLVMGQKFTKTGFESPISENETNRLTKRSRCVKFVDTKSNTHYHSLSSALFIRSFNGNLSTRPENSLWRWTVQRVSIIFLFCLQLTR